jgi:hypothetical protein
VISADPIPVNPPDTIRGNREPNSNFRAESDPYSGAYRASRAEIDEETTIPIEPVRNNARFLISDNLKSDSNVPRKVIRNQKSASLSEFPLMQEQRVHSDQLD